MTTNKLTKKEFTNLFIKPLEKKFNFKVYWSGKQSEEAGLGKITGNVYGWSFTGQRTAPIVMRFRGNQQGTLSTLIHEFAHSVLHRTGTEGNKLSTEAKEIEAETVASSVIKMMGMSHRRESYIPSYQTKFMKKNGYEYRMIGRKHLIDEMIEEVYQTLKSVEHIARNLESTEKRRPTNESEYKYKVTCPCCGNVWKHKRITNVIKAKGKGCYCGSCGKKTQDKLVIEDLRENRLISEAPFTEKEAQEFVEKLVKEKASGQEITRKVESLSKDNALEVAMYLEVDTLTRRETMNYEMVGMIEYFRDNDILLSEVV